MAVAGFGFTEVRKCDDVARVFSNAAAVGDPNLDAGNVSSRIDHRQSRHCGVVVLLVVEVEEVVAIGLVVVCGDFKFLHLGLAGYVDFRAFSFGLREDEIYGRTTKFELCFEAKKRLRARNEGGGQL